MAQQRKIISKVTQVNPVGSAGAVIAALKGATGPTGPQGPTGATGTIVSGTVGGNLSVSGELNVTGYSTFWDGAYFSGDVDTYGVIRAAGISINPSRINEYEGNNISTYPVGLSIVRISSLVIEQVTGEDFPSEGLLFSIHSEEYGIIQFLSGLNGHLYYRDGSTTFTPWQQLTGGGT